MGLPYDMLRPIFNYLDTPTLCACAMTCARFAQIIKADDGLWLLQLRKIPMQWWPLEPHDVILLNARHVVCRLFLVDDTASSQVKSLLMTLLLHRGHHTIEVDQMSLLAELAVLYARMFPDIDGPHADILCSVHPGWDRMFEPVLWHTVDDALWNVGENLPPLRRIYGGMAESEDGTVRLIFDDIQHRNGSAALFLFYYSDQDILKHDAIEFHRKDDNAAPIVVCRAIRSPGVMHFFFVMHLETTAALQQLLPPPS